MSGWTHNASPDVPTQGPQISALAIVFTAVALIVVLLRLYVRAILVKAIGTGKYCHFSFRCF